jgi:hypothetical protein
MTTTKHKEITLTKTGLDVYTLYDVWQVSEDRTCAYFATPGICASTKWHKEEPHLNPKWCNKFVGEVQFDYYNPDTIDSFRFEKYTGTQGHTIFADTLEEWIKKAIDFINSDFEGVREFHSRDIVSTRKIAIKEMAKKAFFHHWGMYPHLHDFRCVALEGNKEYYKEAQKYREYYALQNIASEKYERKLKKAFKTVFDLDLSDYLYQWEFNTDKFLKTKKLSLKNAKEELSPKELKLIQKIFKCYSYWGICSFNFVQKIVISNKKIHVHSSKHNRQQP